MPRLVHSFGGVTTCISLVRKGKVLIGFRRVPVEFRKSERLVVCFLRESKSVGSLGMLESGNGRQRVWELQILYQKSDDKGCEVLPSSFS